ncbi:ATP-dependent Clp protease ATP-binding subunit ClpX, partial [Acinetobacter baumannii]|jgi:ATP-dependent Clp protease ATP-binding subunit ClpX
MYDLPSRTDIGTVIINEAVINDKAVPEFKPERQPKQESNEVEKVDLKVLDSKSA